MGWGSQNLFWVGIKSKKGIRELFICLWAASTRARLLGQVGTDMNDVVGDHSDGQRGLHQSAIRIWDGRRSVIRSIRFAASAFRF